MSAPHQPILHVVEHWLSSSASSAAAATPTLPPSPLLQESQISLSASSKSFGATTEEATGAPAAAVLSAINRVFPEARPRLDAFCAAYCPHKAWGATALLARYDGGCAARIEALHARLIELPAKEAVAPMDGEQQRLTTALRAERLRGERRIALMFEHLHTRYGAGAAPATSPPPPPPPPPPPLADIGSIARGVTQDATCLNVPVPAAAAVLARAAMVPLSAPNAHTGERWPSSQEEKEDGAFGSMVLGILWAPADLPAAEDLQRNAPAAACAGEDPRAGCTEARPPPPSFCGVAAKWHRQLECSAPLPEAPKQCARAKTTVRNNDNDSSGSSTAWGRIAGEAAPSSIADTSRLLPLLGKEMSSTCVSSRLVPVRGDSAGAAISAGSRGGRGMKMPVSHGQQQTEEEGMAQEAHGLLIVHEPCAAFFSAPTEAAARRSPDASAPRLALTPHAAILKGDDASWWQLPRHAACGVSITSVSRFVDASSSTWWGHEML